MPSLDIPSRDLVDTVRDRLGIPQTTGLYFIYEPKADGGFVASTAAAGVSAMDESSPSVVPLSAALPDGAALRAVIVQPQSTVQGQPASPCGPRPASPPGGPFGWLFEANDLPSAKEINTDLANERTVLAWIRTGLAVIRTVFSFATMKGLTKVSLAADVVVTIVLSISAVISLYVGWQRFAVVRMAGVINARRMSIKPLMVVFLGVTLTCCVATVFLTPRKLNMTREVTYVHEAAL